MSPTAASERERIARAIGANPVGASAPWERVSRLLARDFPSYLVAAGYAMRPVEAVGDAPDREGRRAFRFVPPLDWGLDLGMVTVPVGRKPEPSPAICYVFDKALHGLIRNTALLFGQLERFGGDELMVALKLCGADFCFRLLGYDAR